MLQEVPRLKINDTRRKSGSVQRNEVWEMMVMKASAIKNIFHLFWRRKWQPTPAFLPGEFYGQRNLAGYSPWGCKESGMTEQLSLTPSL